jgi:hypothetical protein
VDDAVAAWVQRHVCGGSGSAPGAGGAGGGRRAQQQQQQQQRGGAPSSGPAALAFWGVLAALLSAGPWWARLLLAGAYCAQAAGPAELMLQALQDPGARARSAPWGD